MAVAHFPETSDTLFEAISNTHSTVILIPPLLGGRRIRTVRGRFATQPVFPHSLSLDSSLRPALAGLVQNDIAQSF